MSKFAKLFSLILSIFLFVFLQYSSPTLLAQDNTLIGPAVCGGRTMYISNDGNYYTTFCSAVCVGCTVAQTFQGCGFGQQCFVGERFEGCAGVDLTQCSADEYNYDECNVSQTAGNPYLYDSQSCSSEGGCFIPYPGVGQGGGICVHSQEDVEFNCDNPPGNVCNASEYNICFNNTDEAGLVASDGSGRANLCDCAEYIPDGNGGTTPMCFFEDQASYDAALQQLQEDETPWSDDWCPTCPPGYTVSVDNINGTSVCRSNSMSPPITDPVSFATCGDGQYCDLLIGGGSCRDYINECRYIGVTGDADTFEGCDTFEGRDVSCSIEGYDYCCPSTNNCEEAGGEAQQCIQVPGTTIIAPGGGFIQGCNDAFDGNYPVECDSSNVSSSTYSCCRSRQACSALGGRAPNDGFEWAGCEGNTSGIPTAIGCIDFSNVSSISISLIRFAIGLGGGVTLILIAYAAFVIMTSAGDPKQLAQGREVLTAALIGLVMFAISGLIMRVIGIDVLGLF